VGALARADVWAAGAFALDQGPILAAMRLAWRLVELIERRFPATALAALMAAPARGWG
jgi:AGZA family xanthine/uracil permease-like MFS transporter